MRLIFFFCFNEPISNLPSVVLSNLRFFLKEFYLNFELEKNEKYNITVIVRKNRKVQIQYRKSKPFTLKK